MKRLYVNFKILVATTILLTLSYSVMAQPQQRRTLQPGQKGQSSQMIPGLTEEQRKQVKEIHLARLKAVQPLQDEMKVNNAKLNALFKKENPDMKEIISLVEANAEIQTKTKILSIESMIKTRSLLTDEQKILFDAGGGKMRKARFARASVRHREFQGRGRMYQQRSR